MGWQGRPGLPGCTGRRSALPDDPVPNEQQFHQTAAGRRLCYAEYGAPAGTPLFYFHGWPSSRFQARLLDAPAKERGLRVIATDRPGIGRSDPQPGRRLRDWPPLVAELADRLGLERFLCMGVSGGGPYSLACAASLPERVRAASIISGAPPLRDFPDRSELMFPYRALLAMRPAAALLMPPLLPAIRAISQQDPDHIPLRWVLGWLSDVDRRAVASRPGLFRVLTESFHEGVAQGVPPVVADADIYTHDWEIDYHAIETPVDFWHGALDHNLPLSMVKELADRIPSARVHWIADEGHYSLPLNRDGEILDSLLGLTAGSAN